MKRLLLILVFLFAYSAYSQDFDTDFPEKTHWTIRKNVLYADYAHSEKGKFKKKVYEYREPGTNAKIWFIKYPDFNLIYTIRVVGNTAVITKSRKV